MILIRKKMVVFLIVIGLSIILINLLNGKKEKKKMVIDVEGFEVEYSLTNKKLIPEDFNGIKLGSSMSEINDELGEPDVWIGSGMMRPVYFLKDNRVVVLHFKYPAICGELRQIVLIEENGERKVLKEE